MRKRKTPASGAAQPVTSTKECRLPVLPDKDWKDEWANFYVHVPLHVPVMDVDREWLFATKEEAEGFAKWLDEMLGFLEYFWAKEKMARYGMTVKDAAENFINHRNSSTADELERGLQSDPPTPARRFGRRFHHR